MLLYLTVFICQLVERIANTKKLPGKIGWFYILTVCSFQPVEWIGNKKKVPSKIRWVYILTVFIVN